MHDASETRPTTLPRAPGWFRFALASTLVGVLSGGTAALFRMALAWADRSRDAFVGWAHGFSGVGVLMVAGIVATLAGGAAWLVRRFAPEAGGSGVPHAEAVVGGELPPAPLSLLPVKFLGGWMAIGGGLALGREGPSVQMGASLAGLLGRRMRWSALDVRALIAAGAGAGLATAFNAPMAALVFVFEELTRRFEARVAVASLAAIAGAITLSRGLLGAAPDFSMPTLASPGLGSGVLFAGVGLVAGVAGVAYQAVILRALALADRCVKWPAWVLAAAIGFGVGVAAWFAPGSVGGGDPLTQQALSGVTDGTAITAMTGLFAFRFLLGPMCYAAGTPGGIFAPMLVLGAQIGALLAAFCPAGMVGGIPPAAVAVVGMAAFFTAVVRAPLTGILLVAELTGNHSLMLPMLVGAVTASIVPAMLGVRPIYDVLKERTVQRAENSFARAAPRTAPTPSSNSKLS